MQPILANYTASITELKKSPTQILEQAGSEAVAILNHNIASAYLVPSELYEKMMDVIDDYYLVKDLLRVSWPVEAHLRIMQLNCKETTLRR